MIDFEYVCQTLCSKLLPRFHKYIHVNVCLLHLIQSYFTQEV